jgi:hypothetical protein
MTDLPSSPNIASAAAEPAASAASASPIPQIIDDWFNRRICNSPVSRDTAIFHYVREAVDDLKAKLEGK